jgi:hypothetical protein
MYLGERVLSKAGIEDGIRDLVSNLIGVTLTDRLGGEEESVRLRDAAHCELRL